MKAFCLFALIVIVFAFAASITVGATQYAVTPISPVGAYSAQAYGVSNSGYVVGSWKRSASDSSQAFIWDTSHGFRSLSVPIGTYTLVAFAVNDQGVAVGQYCDSLYAAPYSCYWDAGGNFHSLDSSSYNYAVGINNAGLAVAGKNVWDLNGTPTMVATLPFTARAINDLGQVVESDGSVFVRNADGTVRTVVDSQNTYALAWGINNLGATAGSKNGTPTMWDSAGPHAISTLIGDPEGCALGINDIGTVVGYCDAYPAAPHHAFVWTVADGTKALPGLGGTETYAYGINQSGMIVGSASVGTGLSPSPRAVIWTPVPEPSSIVALLLGVGGLVGVVRPKLRRR